MKNVCAVILAAGDGKRMKSAFPKVMCEVLFKPMIAWVAQGVLDAGITACCAVLGADAERVAGVLPETFVSVMQHERRGTGHAVMMAADYIRKGSFEQVVVLCGDAPFIRPDDLRSSHALHVEQGNQVTVLSARLDNPAGYGRIVRSDGRVTAIVEQADADDETKRINEISSGAFWFDAAFLLEALENLSCDNAQGEYYLPDTVGYAVRTGKRAGACIVGENAVLGANDRKTLAALNRIARDEVLDFHWANGVDIPFPDTVVIGADVEIGPDTVILPGTVLRGKTRIGRGCEIGPNSYLNDAVLGDGCRILSSQIERSKLEDNVKIGPMSNVRPDCHISAGVKVGDFVELKNSNVGQRTSVAHLTYVGDTDVGRDCNFGCGVVTVNYDGNQKYRTVIGDDVFVGCNTNLIAPVRLGDRVYAAAGTTVTEDVPDDALVIGRQRQTVKAQWSVKTGKFSKKK